MVATGTQIGMISTVLAVLFTFHDPLRHSQDISMDLTLRHGLLFTDSFFETDSSWPYSSRSQTKAPCCSPYTRQCQGGIGPVCIVEPHDGAARDDDAHNDAARCLRHYSICTPPMHTPARLPRPFLPSALTTMLNPPPSHASTSSAPVRCAKHCATMIQRFQILSPVCCDIQLWANYFC